MTFVKKNLSKYLKSKKQKTDTYNYIIRLFKDISISHEKLRKVGVSPPELSKINDHLRNMIVEFENIINIKNYRTPNSLRTYTKVFLNFFPIIFGPFFAHIAIKYNLIFGLILAVLYGIVPTSLDNIQEDLEDPFDGIRTDDISLDFPAMLEPSVTNDN